MAYHLETRVVRNAGLRSWRHGLIDLTMGNRRRAETLLRDALERLVFAFLRDRAGNAGLFVLVHRIGALVEEEFGCPYTYDEKQGGYFHNCPITKLHNRVDVSVGGTSRSRCSICGAEEFDCDHVPGRQYDGEYCVREIYDFKLDEVSLTQNPNFPETFGFQVMTTPAEIRAVLGRDPGPHERVLAHHCRDCYGRYEVRPDDLDITLWEPVFGGHDPG